MAKICHIEITPADAMPRVWREAESARDHGFSVVIVGEGRNEERNGISYMGFEKAPGRFHRFFIRSRKMVNAAIASDADIIQLHSPELLLYAGKLKQLGRKVIFDSHENYPTQILGKPYIPLFLRKLVSKAYSAFETAVCRRIDAVLSPCTFHGADIFEGRAKRSVIIANYSRTVPVILAGEPQRQAVHAGLLTPERGITKAAEAIMKTDGKLILCGAFANEDYQAKITAYPAEKVDYRGLLDRRTLFEVYGTCAVGVSTLLPVGQYANTDNLSTKIYEYMQCGMPVVMSDFPYAKAKNEQYHFGICVDPENETEIAEAIQYLLDHPEEARRMGENGRRAVEEAFNWSVEEKKLLALYEDILKD
ncbi:MAG: glycosyltransferase family 4 protein [Ruminococcaceae bacterium]|nr:glycosyltransferase family 4 protein [Oscillospiraceae bacterium]